MPKSFFSRSEQARIAEAIQAAEKHTSGEIKVHVTTTSAGFDDIVNQAAALFERLKLDHTRHRNGVLISIAKDDRKIAIWGDKGIHEVVPEGYWQSTLELIRAQMKKGHYAEGVIEGIHHIGQKLKKHFPAERNDTNELSDTVLFE